MEANEGEPKVEHKTLPCMQRKETVLYVSMSRSLYVAYVLFKPCYIEVYVLSYSKSPQNQGLDQI